VRGPHPDQPIRESRVVVRRIAGLDQRRDGERIPERAEALATMRSGWIGSWCVRTRRPTIAIHRQTDAIDDRVMTCEIRIIPRIGEPDLPVKARVAELAIEAT